MFETTAQLGSTLFDYIWGLFGIYVPGFCFTFGQMWIGIAVCSLSLLVLKLFFNIGGRGVSSRTGSTNKAKISDNRKGDEY